MSVNLKNRSAMICAVMMLHGVVLGPAFAVLPEEMLKDLALEQRARNISAELRCLVCQNQSIDDSNAPLAKDLRVIVRERITAGDDDDQVVGYIVARYGNYVLLKPPLQTDTALLWFAPYLMMAAALAVVLTYFSRRSPLPDEEAAAQAQTDKQEI